MVLISEISDSSFLLTRLWQIAIVDTSIDVVDSQLYLKHLFKCSISGCVFIMIYNKQAKTVAVVLKDVATLARIDSYGQTYCISLD